MDFIEMRDAAEWLGLGALVGTLALCVAGVFSEHYRDNWAQFVGLWSIILADSMRLCTLVERIYVHGDLRMSWSQITLHVGLLLFALGTAAKVHTHARPRVQHA